MKISHCIVSPIQTNCYVVEDGGKAIVVDPGDNAEVILSAIEGLDIQGIVLTHNHWDHTGAVPVLVEELGCPVMAHEVDADDVFKINDSVVRMTPASRAAHQRAVEKGMQVDRRLVDGDQIQVGEAVFTVVHTPGHTPGCICLWCPEESVLITGDTVFAGGRYGRTDFAGGSMEKMKESLSTKFAQMPDETVVLPGHESFSDLGRERALNPFLV